MAATKRNTSRKKAVLKTSQAQRFLEKAEKLMNTFSHNLSIREFDSFNVIINPDNQDSVILKDGDSVIAVLQLSDLSSGCIYHREGDCVHIAYIILHLLLYFSTTTLGAGYKQVEKIQTLADILTFKKNSNQTPKVTYKFGYLNNYILLYGNVINAVYYFEGKQLPLLLITCSCGSPHINKCEYMEASTEALFDNEGNINDLISMNNNATTMSLLSKAAKTEVSKANINKVFADFNKNSNQVEVFVQPRVTLRTNKINHLIASVDDYKYHRNVGVDENEGVILEYKEKEGTGDYSVTKYTVKKGKKIKADDTFLKKLSVDLDYINFEWQSDFKRLFTLRALCLAGDIPVAYKQALPGRRRGTINSLNERTFSKDEINISIHVKFHARVVELQLIPEIGQERIKEGFQVSGILVITDEYIYLPKNDETSTMLLNYFNNQDSSVVMLINEFSVENNFEMLIKSFIEAGIRVTHDENKLFYINQIDPTWRIDLESTPDGNTLFLMSVHHEKQIIEDFELDSIEPIREKGNKIRFDYIPHSEINYWRSKLSDAIGSNGSKNQREVWMIPTVVAEQSNLIGKIVAKLRMFGFEVNGTEQFKGLIYSEHSATIVENLFEEIDWFDVKVDVYFGSNKVKIDKLIEAIKANEAAIELQDGTLGIIDNGLRDRMTSLMGQTNYQSNKNTFRANKRNLILIGQIAERSNNISTLNEVTQKLSRIEANKTTKVKIPSTIKGEPRSYQLEGMQYLTTMEELGLGCVLADEMGLGKTYQVIVLVEHLRIKYKKQFAGVLIICPVGVLQNWVAEFDKYRPGLNIGIFHDKNRDEIGQDLSAYDVVITTYGTTIKSIDKLKEKKWQLVVTDEGHAFRNPSTKTAKTVNQLASEMKVVITGTPIVNNAMDAYSILSFANENMLGSKAAFQNYFNLPISKGDTNKLSELRALINPFIIRRLKANVLKDLPPKTVTEVLCTMNDDQRAYYEAVRRKILDDIKSDRETGTISTKHLVGIQKLRQACLHPMMGNDMTVDQDASSVKLEMLVDHLHEIIGDHKVLVFSYFRKFTKIISRRLDKEGIMHVTYDGTMSLKQKNEAIALFTTSKANVLLLTLKAGGEGLNLPEADYVFIMDPWWAPTTEDQAIDRSHRYGQKNSVTAIKYICYDSIEAKMVQLKQRKQFTADNLIKEDESFSMASKLTMEDLKFLVG